MKPIARLAALLVAAFVVAPVSAQRSSLPPPGPIEHINGNLYEIFGGSVIALPDALEKAAATVKNVDTVIEGHGYAPPARAAK